MPKPSEDAWIIESFVGGVGWSMSRLNETDQPHGLEWCLDRWRKFRTPPHEPTAYELKHTTDPHKYRLRNITTNDTIMCAIL